MGDLIIIWRTQSGERHTVGAALQIIKKLLYRDVQRFEDIREPDKGNVYFPRFNLSDV